MNTINNILEYLVSRESLFYCDLENNLYFNNDILSKNIQSHSLEIKGKYLYYFNGESQYFIFNIEENVSYTFHYGISFKNFEDFKCICSYQIERINRDFFWKTGILDIKENRVIKKIDSLNNCSVFFQKHDIICYKKRPDLIGAIHLPTETTLWQYAITELGAEKVSKILGVFGQTLVVVGQISEYTYMLLGLDVQSGQLLWKHEEIFAPNNEGRKHPVKLYPIFPDIEADKVIIFGAGYYIELLGSTGKIIKWVDIFKAPPSFGKYQMDAYAFDICDADEEYIYFRTCVPGYGMYSGAGIFNRKTDQLEFLDVILSENGRPISIGPQKVKATKEKFYVLDNQNTLHIYERE